MQTQKSFDNDNTRQRIWRFDPAYSTVEFSVKKLFVFTVRGNFANVEGSLVFDDTDITRSFVVATIRSESIQTGNDSRDKSLRSADFLDASEHPFIEFKSSLVKPGQDGA